MLTHSDGIAAGRFPSTRRAVDHASASTPSPPMHAASSASGPAARRAAARASTFFSRERVPATAFHIAAGGSLRSAPTQKAGPSACRTATWSSPCSKAR